jgi:amidase
MKFTEYLQHDAVALADIVARGEASSSELLDLALAQSRRAQPRTNAVCRLMESQARSQLKGPLQGPLAGVPFLIKDCAQDYAGCPTTYGSKAFATLAASEHAHVVRRYLDAGLVIFGKTNTPEFGSKGVTEPTLFGATRNPYDLGRTPGGSSGGAAAAVAAGIVPVAGASDGGGSIRIPAGCCGLFGLKPSRGLVSWGQSVGEPLQGSATNGVISRSVRDSAAMLDVLAGADAASPYLPAIPDGSFLDEVGRDPGKLRIGFHTDSKLNPSTDPAAIAAVSETAKLLEELGHHVEPVDSPSDDAALARDFLTTWFANLAWDVDATKKLTGAGDEGFEQDTLLTAALGRATRAVDLVDAVERRHLYVRDLARFHERYDLLLTPTLSRRPLRIGELDSSRVERCAAQVLLKTRTTRLLPHLGVVDQLIQDNLGWVPYTQLANITGRPATSVPLHWTPDGLPLGVQFVGRLGADGLLLRLAAQLEAARPWADRRPAL